MWEKILQRKQSGVLKNSQLDIRHYYMKKKLRILFIKSAKSTTNRNYIAKIFQFP